MYFVLFGVDYMDSKSMFPELPGIAQTVDKVRKSVEKYSGKIYDVELATFLNRDATSVNWKKFVNEFIEKNVSQIAPDDIFLLYMAGHGTLDPKTGKYYYASYDTDFAKYASLIFEDCIGFNDIQPLYVLPCRRIILLETCQFSPHDLQDPMQDYRLMEENQFILVTAAQPGKSAIWTDNNSIGRFTKYVVRGWQGEADAFNSLTNKVAENQRDGKVTLCENYDFLMSNLKQENRSSNDKQTADIFNKDLLRHIDIPLSEHDYPGVPDETKGVRTIVTPARNQQIFSLLPIN